MAELERGMSAGGGRGRLRASDADRERAIDTLKAAYVYGLVTKQEFDARVGQTLAARTHAELAVITDDIPAGLAPAPPPLTPAPAQASPPAHANLRPGQRAVVATAVLSGLLFVATFFADNAMAPLLVPPLVLGAIGSALVSMLLAGAQMINERRETHSGGQLPAQPPVHGGPGAGRQAASPPPAKQPLTKQLPYTSKPRRPGKADAAGRRSLRPQVSG
jgi:hypothetical protein